MNNKKGLWFKAKKYGYGWVPCSIEGWLITLVYVLIIAYLANAYIHTKSLNSALGMSVSTILFVIIAIKKGEKTKWQGGGKTYLSEETEKDDNSRKERRR